MAHTDWDGKGRIVFVCVCVFMYILFSSDPKRNTASRYCGHSVPFSVCYLVIICTVYYMYLYLIN